MRVQKWNLRPQSRSGREHRPEGRHQTRTGCLPGEVSKVYHCLLGAGSSKKYLAAEHGGTGEHTEKERLTLGWGERSGERLMVQEEQGDGRGGCHVVKKETF